MLAGQEYAAKIINTKKLSARGRCWGRFWGGEQGLQSMEFVPAVRHWDDALDVQLGGECLMCGGNPLSHPVSNAELFDGWGEHPEEVAWWLLPASHPSAGMHLQLSCARALGAPGPQPAWGAVGPHFSPQDPTTALHSMSQQNHGYSLAASQAAAGLGCWVAWLFREHHLCERVPTDPPLPAFRGCGFPYSCPYTSEMGRSLGWGSAFIPG